MANYYSFSQDAVEAAINAAKSTHEGTELDATKNGFDIKKGGHLAALAECISVKVEDHKICIELPLGLGSHCISIPLTVPNGTAAQACLTICTTWGIPTGVKVEVKVAGVTVISQSFGKC
ncbi:hypothetical protein [Flavilitoribacter nigricans]|uniref:Uncharacterized protein n=1 Tax=Flavilitoribacter nigricans (strain ATCC 23147 / DSM 23189 / NBRC 102662 / NCIMB 1420 / SS-2) TaxID=1122177 RepID=A0A2D0NGS8_FLAN2|nr:hypothetical protein [Flavilitoribacter nigricans]PHN07618.1 hypothetical protein CRP01_05820 [Flavilitoribacter nigricans DSM 23189 = NBRC 102662]